MDFTQHIAHSELARIQNHEVDVSSVQTISAQVVFLHSLNGASGIL